MTGLIVTEYPRTLIITAIWCFCACWTFYKKNPKPSKLSLSWFGWDGVEQEALYPLLPCFSSVLPGEVFSQQLSRKHSFPLAIFSTFMFLPRQAGSQYRDLEAFPANCQLVNLIGLSPWAPFLNQLGGELTVTSFSQAGCLEAHHPREVKHPNGKMLTSTAESYHILKFILYNYCKISSRKKAKLSPFFPLSLFVVHRAKICCSLFHPGAQLYPSSPPFATLPREHWWLVSPSSQSQQFLGFCCSRNNAQ